MNQDLIQTLKGEKVDSVLTKSFAEGLRQARLVVQSRYTGVDSVLRALSTGASGSGSDFLPTDFSPELVLQFRQALLTAGLFRHVPMPTKNYTMPVQGNPATAYLVPENTADSGNSPITASTPGTANVTFTAHDLGAMTFISMDETEDSIIPMIPFIQENLVRGLAEGIEQAIINGDTTSTHQDSDVTSASDARKAWKGLRKYAIANGYTKDLSTFNLSTLRSMRKTMGKYGVNPDRLAWIVSNSAYNQMLSFAEVETVNVYGAGATVVNGILEKIDGIPVFTSAFMRQDLNASGVYDGTTTTKTGVLLVHRDSFLVGNRQDIRLLQEPSPIEYRMWKVIADMRLDFEPTYAMASNPTVVYGINITA